MKRAGSVVCMSLYVFEMLWLDTKGEWHFWPQNQNGEERMWTLNWKNETSRQNNFTRATKAHYEIRALPSCATHINENHKVSFTSYQLLNLVELKYFAQNSIWLIGLLNERALMIHCNWWHIAIDDTLQLVIHWCVLLGSPSGDLAIKILIGAT